jgi:hypothetical protein
MMSEVLIFWVFRVGNGHSHRLFSQWQAPSGTFTFQCALLDEAEERVGQPTSLNVREVEPKPLQRQQNVKV